VRGSLAVSVILAAIFSRRVRRVVNSAVPMHAVCDGVAHRQHEQYAAVCSTRRTWLANADRHEERSEAS
jgi:hypothetical protein